MHYHDMVSIFKGATVECDLEDLDEKIFEVMDNYDEFAKRTDEYRTAILNVDETICDIVDNALKD